MPIAHFRKKPVVISAVQITTEMFAGDHPNSLHFATPDITYHPAGQYVTIRTLEGTMTGALGDWIIRGVNGEFYPCKPDIFEKTYEAVAVDAKGEA